jgi:restriction system protein
VESTIWHYPPDLMALMVDTVPRLVKGKRDLIAFFEGAGVEERHLSSLRERLRIDKDSVSKCAIARSILEAANKQTGDEGLRVRREIVKRVTQFMAFDTLYANDVLLARGGVQAIREFVRARDTATRLDEHLERERSQNMARARKDAEAKQTYLRDRECVRLDLASLFSEKDVWKRGRLLEKVLNRLFALDGVSIREAFALRLEDGGGIGEQIDGVVELDGHTYLVEAKWWHEALGVGDVSQHMIRVPSSPD